MWKISNTEWVFLKYRLFRVFMHLYWIAVEAMTYITKIHSTNFILPEALPRSFFHFVLYKKIAFNPVRIHKNQTKST